MAIANLNEIEKSLGLEEGKLNEMLTSDEEHSIDLSNLLIEPKSIYEERVKNMKDHASNTAREIIIKNIKKEFGLEFEGKYENNLIEAFKKRDETIKSEVIKDPEQRYVSLKTDFEKLQKNLEEAQKEKANLEATFANKEKQNKIQNDLFKVIPDNTLVSKSTILLEANTKGYSFDIEEGITVVKDAKGEIIKDERTLSPVSVEQWAKNFVTPYLKPIEGGGGGGDDTNPAKAGSFEAFEKEAQKKGWTSTEMSLEMSKRIQQGTLKI